MSPKAVLAPVFVQVLLTFGLLFWTGRVRFAAARAGAVKLRDISLGERSWPAPVQQVSNAFGNQFELPVLFYVVVGLALATRQADPLFVGLAWLFVLTRIVHAGIYATRNVVIRRFQAFLAGAIVLMAMWLVFAARILLAPAA
ncbi:MAPEG family protein [Methylobacterium nonmethylotrophicum]|uniref:MAPEG family protein n=1 Tax=Methylobacterium nonmethylotrophicum TaxID=1141884 RepID=A0A4Z0NQ24_9HYPH|nr:MAPEG family protein [Methylobacterium nonmethylotrophicum]TGD99033.1 MAPEG family protein [Methylobacterium nonmethylotrophicum]